MSDLRIQYDEEMVGADHPTKSDTLNRLMLAEHDNGGKHRALTLPEQAGDPATGLDEGALYSKDAGGGPELFYRGESDGSVVQLTEGGAVAGSPKGYIAGLLFQYASASSFTVTSGAIDILGKLYAAASTMTVSGLSGLGANANQYIKVGAPSSGRTFGLAQVSLTATAPTWSDTYLGWYCGNDRVIGWLRTDASGNIRRFFVGGGVWSLVDSITEISTTSPPTSATAFSLSLPALGNMAAIVAIYINASSGSISAYNADNGSAAPLSVGTVFQNQGLISGILMTTSAQQIKWKCTTSSVYNAAIILHGAMIPSGLAGR